MGFADDLKKFAEKALLDANNSVCNASESLFTDVVVLSPNSPTRTGPFSTGVVKGNWMPALNGFDYSFSPNADPSGGSSLSRIKALMATKPFLGKDATVTLTNSAPYINFVNSLGWPKNYPTPTGWKWSGRSGPYLMVETAILNFQGAYS